MEEFCGFLPILIVCLFFVSFKFQYGKPEMMRAPFLFPLPTAKIMLIFLLICLSFLPSLYSLAQSCSDGAPAVFLCNVTRVEGRRVHVCALDLALGCELVDEQFYCCAQRPDESTTLSPIEMLLVDRMVIEELKNNTVSSEMGDFLEVMNDANDSEEMKWANSTLSINSTEAVAKNIDEQPVERSAEKFEEGKIGMTKNLTRTRKKIGSTTMATTMKPPGRMMLKLVERHILVDNSVEGEQREEEEEEEDGNVNGTNNNGTTMGTTTTPSTNNNNAMMTTSNNNMTASTPTPTTSTITTTTTLMPPKETTKRPICIDIGPQCLLTAKLCQNPQYSRLVHLQCPRTCNLCASDGHRIDGGDMQPKCADRGKDCAKAEFLCRKSPFAALMAVECPKTCGHCENNSNMSNGKEGKNMSGTSHLDGVKTRKTGKSDKMKGRKGGKSTEKEDGSSQQKCMDAYQRCYVWRLQGFCTSSNYSEFLKRRYCAKTCNFCSEGPEKM